MGLGAECQVHICLGVAPAGVRGGVGVSASGLQPATLCCSLSPGSDGRDAGGAAGSSGSGAEHPAPQSAGASTEEPQSPRVSAASLRTLCSLYLRPSFFCLFFFLSQTVVPKIANLRNHREANTNANTRGFIYKLELVSKYTRQSGAGTWTPRWVLAYF